MEIHSVHKLRMVRFLPSVRAFICYSVKVYLLPVNRLLMLIGRILLLVNMYVHPFQIIKVLLLLILLPRQ